MRTSDVKYITNLAKQVTSEKIMKGLSAAKPLTLRKIFLVLGPTIESKLKKMSNETLGKICSYAIGEKPIIAEMSGFIRQTTICEVFGNDSLLLHSSGRELSGRELLEIIAQAVIISVVGDILKQPEYEVERLKTRE